MVFKSIKEKTDKQKDDLRTETFLKSLGHGKSIVEIEKEEEVKE